MRFVLPNALTRSIAAIALLAVPGALCATEPTLRNLNIRGLQIGGTTTLAVDGDDFGKTPRLLLPLRAKQSLKPGNTDKQATFEIALDTDVTPGYHHLRVVTEGGVSLPMVIAVDRLPQRVLAASVDQLPVALHGVVSGSSTVETKFQGKAGQKVMVEVEAQRLGSKLRPILHLSSPKNLQLAWAWGTPSLFGDARLEATLPEDGTYAVTLHDTEYAAPAPSYFRVRIGQWAYVDQVFPAALRIGSKQALELIPSQPQRVEMMAAVSPGFMPLGFPKSDWSGPQPFLIVSPHPEVNEQLAPGKLLDIPAGPNGVNGRLSAPYEEDRFKVAVTPGTKLRFQVLAERIGSPIDTALVIRNEKGDPLARSEDSPGSVDPVLEYTVPDKATAIIVGVVDASGRGGPRGIYRLVIDPQSPAAKSFKATTTTQRLSIAAGGRAVLPILLERRGYDGKIDVALTSPGIRVDGGTIPEGTDGALLTLQRDDVAMDAQLRSLQMRDAAGMDYPVMIKGHPMERLQPWLATEIALAPTSQKAADFQIDWNNLPSDLAIVPGMKRTLPLKVTRINPKTIVKLTLMTSQNVPLVNNQPDPNKALRLEKVVELPADAKGGDLILVTPVDLSAPVYDIAIQAELQSPDKKITYATAYTPVKRLPVRLPLVVELAGGAKIDAIVDPKKGGSVKIVGKVERREGLKGDVTLALTGLPPGAKADGLTLKADAAEFAVTVTLPPNVAIGEIKGLKLGASAAPDPKQPAQRVKSKEQDIRVVVKTLP